MIHACVILCKQFITDYETNMPTIQHSKASTIEHFTYNSINNLYQIMQLMHACVIQCKQFITGYETNMPTIQHNKASTIEHFTYNSINNLYQIMQLMQMSYTPDLHWTLTSTKQCTGTSTNCISVIPFHIKLTTCAETIV